MKLLNHIIETSDHRCGIAFKILASVFHVCEKTMKNGMILYDKGSSKSWEYIEIAGIIFILNIPIGTRKKRSIPVTYAQVAARLQCEDIDSTDKSEEILTSELKAFCDENWPRCTHNYNQDYTDPIKIEKKSRIEAAMHFVIARRAMGFDIGLLHKIIVVNSNLNNSENPDIKNKNQLHLDFNPGSGLRYFKEKLDRAIKLGFSTVLKNGNEGKVSEKKLPYDTTQDALALLAAEEGYKMTMVTKKLKAAGIKISYKSVWRIHKANTPLTDLGANGMKSALINSLPYLVGENVNNPGDCAEADGTRNAVICRNNSGEIEFYRTYSILDGYSGYATSCIGPSENGLLALAAWELYVEESGFMPREVWCDGGPCTKGERFEEFKEQSATMGVVWQPSKKATELPKAERFNHTMDTTVLSGKKFYSGEGITSANNRKGPSDELLNEWRNDPNIPTTEDIRSLHYDHLQEYRNQVISQTDKGLVSKKSAKQKWNSEPPINAVQISAIQRVILFAEKSEVSMERGMFFFKPTKHGKQTDVPLQKFTAYENELYENYEGQKLIVRYYLRDMSKAYLFTTENKFLIIIQPSPSSVKPKFLQTDQHKENLNRHRNGLRKLTSNIGKKLAGLKERKKKLEEKTIIPIEASTHYDSKDNQDEAFKKFMAITGEVEKETLARRTLANSEKMTG